MCSPGRLVFSRLVTHKVTPAAGKLLKKAYKLFAVPFAASSFKAWLIVSKLSNPSNVRLLVNAFRTSASRSFVSLEQGEGKPKKRSTRPSTLSSEGSGSSPMARVNSKDGAKRRSACQSSAVLPIPPAPCNVTVSGFFPSSSRVPMRINSRWRPINPLAGEGRSLTSAGRNRS